VSFPIPIVTQINLLVTLIGAIALEDRNISQKPYLKEGLIPNPIPYTVNPPEEKVGLPEGSQRWSGQHFAPRIKKLHQDEVANPQDQ
jgi:hypothetical protein